MALLASAGALVPLARTTCSLEGGGLPAYAGPVPMTEARDSVIRAGPAAAAMGRRSRTRVDMASSLDSWCCDQDADSGPEVAIGRRQIPQARVSVSRVRRPHENVATVLVDPRALEE